MFFRREKIHQSTFEERIANLKQFGFQSIRQSADDKARVTRGCIGAIIDNARRQRQSEDRQSRRAGWRRDRRAGEPRLPDDRAHALRHRIASAGQSHLKELHAFDEDLREGLGLTSLYNVSLGTTTDEHLYDRVSWIATKVWPLGLGRNKMVWQTHAWVLQ